MADEPTIPRSRRAVLGAALAAGTAAVANGLAGPAGVRAANGDTVTVGGTFTGTARTTIDTSASTVTTFRAIVGTGGGDSQAAIKGEAMQVGSSSGVFGETLNGCGVRGEATNTGFGVLAHSVNGIGLSGSSAGPTDQPAAIGIHTGGGTGIVGKSASGYPAFRAKTGVHGYAAQDAGAVGVVGESTMGVGVLAISASNDGAAGVTAAADRSGVYGVNSVAGGYGVFGRNTATEATGYLGGDAGVVGVHPATAGETRGVLGQASSPDGFGVVGVNTAASGGAGVAGFAQSTSGQAAGVQGQASSPDGFGVLGDSLAEDPTARAMVGHAPAGTGVLGWAGGGEVPGGRAATGVFGYAAIDASAVGVRGESPAGTGVQAVSTTGNALRVSGKARFNRSGRASVAKGRTYVDVTVPGGLASNSIVSATIQMYRAGVAVAGVRLNYPATGKIRIYLTKVASTTSSTPVAWFVTEYGS